MGVHEGAVTEHFDRSSVAYLPPDASPPLAPPLPPVTPYIPSPPYIPRHTQVIYLSPDADTVLETLQTDTVRAHPWPTREPR